MEFPSYPRVFVWFITAALYLGVLVLLASPFVAVWWLWHHIFSK